MSTSLPEIRKRQRQLKNGTLVIAPSNDLERCEQAIQAAKAAGVSAIIGIGKQLKIAQNLLSHRGDGEFITWAVTSCGLAKSSIYNYVAAYEAFGDCPIVGHSFDARAVYLLASDKVPEEATKEAIRVAESGARVTYAVAKEIAASFASKHTPEKEPVLPAEWDQDRLMDEMRTAVVRVMQHCHEKDVPWIACYIQRLAKEVSDGTIFTDEDEECTLKDEDVVTEYPLPDLQPGQAYFADTDGGLVEVQLHERDPQYAYVAHHRLDEQQPYSDFTQRGINLRALDGAFRSMGIKLTSPWRSEPAKSTRAWFVEEQEA